MLFKIDSQRGAVYSVGSLGSWQRAHLPLYNVLPAATISELVAVVADFVVFGASGNSVRDEMTGATFFVQANKITKQVTERRVNFFIQLKLNKGNVFYEILLSPK
jgi:hypothetical protein